MDWELLPISHPHKYWCWWWTFQSRWWFPQSSWDGGKISIHLNIKWGNPKWKVFHSFSQKSASIMNTVYLAFVLNCSYQNQIHGDWKYYIKIPLSHHLPLFAGSFLNPNFWKSAKVSMSNPMTNRIAPIMSCGVQAPEGVR